MELIIAGIVAVFLILIIAMHAIAKIVNAQKLFFRAFYSFMIILIVLGGVTYAFRDSFIEKLVFPDDIEVFPEETPFAVSHNHGEVAYFKSYAEAVSFSRELNAKSPVYFQKPEIIVWKKTDGLPSEVLQVPLILQLPELQRGAEITSLAMLLHFAGEKVHKLELAEKIRKDTTPLIIEENRIYFGNPFDGFVGNPYSADEPGYGVYHGPIADLAEEYLPEKIIDMTGASFEDILYPIHNGHPVWTIIHTHFTTLPESAFQTWLTPSGEEIEATKYHHAVLITGYDEKNVYFNDPLSQEVNQPVPKDQFKLAWIQMGSQAISYINKEN
jgi:uncharacterized protein YvpB